jgi:SNW domain-containing protein 1
MGNPHLKQRNKAASTLSSGSGAGAGAIVAATTASAPSAFRAIVNVEVDASGQVSYDAIVKGGTNADKIVYTKLSDALPSDRVEDDVALPTAEEEAAEAARTQAALQAVLTSKTALDKPSGTALMNAATSQNMEEKTQFLKYTANPMAPGYNPAAAQRIIQMVPAQVDPMMPPKHRHVKAPRGPAEDPVPVLHAPASGSGSKKLSKEEQQAWQVPACISNWKNTRGYTIPLDKRLAADGRGLHDASGTINTANFAALSESLYLAEQQARHEVRVRALTQKKLLLQEKEAREQELRELAQQARNERGGGGAAPTSLHKNNKSSNSGDEGATRGGGGALESIETVPSSDDDNDDGSDLDNEEEKAAARQREKLRLERKRERELELRNEQNIEFKKRQRLEEERDVSERIALGQHSTGDGGNDAAAAGMDSRLYNTSSGMDSGFGADDEYNAYSKPLFHQQDAGASASIYRPTRGGEMDADDQYDSLKQQGITSKFQPHKGFGGAEGGMGTAGSRTAPVQFEKSSDPKK